MQYPTPPLFEKKFKIFYISKQFICTKPIKELQQKQLHGIKEIVIVNNAEKPIQYIATQSENIGSNPDTAKAIEVIVEEFLSGANIEIEKALNELLIQDTIMGILKTALHQLLNVPFLKYN
jgi:hypothetical protein